MKNFENLDKVKNITTRYGISIPIYSAKEPSENFQIQKKKFEGARPIEGRDREGYFHKGWFHRWVDAKPNDHFQAQALIELDDGQIKILVDFIKFND